MWSTIISSRTRRIRLLVRLLTTVLPLVPLVDKLVDAVLRLGFSLDEGGNAGGVLMAVVARPDGPQLEDAKGVTCETDARLHERGSAATLSNDRCGQDLDRKGAPSPRRCPTLFADSGDRSSADLSPTHDER